jgi:hypothetical protein
MTSANTDRKTAAAIRRRRAYEERLGRARSDRDRLHALVWWWLSEVRKQPKRVRPVEIKKLEALAGEMNEGGESR